jgi:hypothetical protein
MLPDPRRQAGRHLPRRLMCLPSPQCDGLYTIIQMHNVLVWRAWAVTIPRPDHERPHAVREKYEQMRDFQNVQDLPKRIFSAARGLARSAGLCS